MLPTATIMAVEMRFTVACQTQAKARASRAAAPREPMNNSTST